MQEDFEGKQALNNIHPGTQTSPQIQLFDPFKAKEDIWQVCDGKLVQVLGDIENPDLVCQVNRVGEDLKVLLAQAA